jgi:hypothetical protein
VSRICAPSACNASTASSVSGFISRARASSRVGLGRHHLDEFFLAHGLQRVVDSPFIERHRVGMSGIEPADRCCTDTREHSSVLVSRLNKFIDAQTTPNVHHLQCVSTANVMMSADRIFSPICSFEGYSLISRRMSVRHFRNLPKYSWTRFQYLSESELAVGIKSSFGFFWFESRIVSRSIEAVPLFLSPRRRRQQSPFASVHLTSSRIRALRADSGRMTGYPSIIR